MSYLDEQLRDFQQQTLRQQELNNQLKAMYQQLRQIEERVRQFNTIRQAEQSDVDKLQGHSLTRLYYSIIGNLDEKLDQEQQEAYTAAVKHETAVREMAAIVEDIDRKEAELASLSGCNLKYRELLDEKAVEIKASGSAEALAIMELEKQLVYSVNQEREIQEAAAAGRTALGIVDSIQSSLSSAENWGTWDVLGGGLISDLAKHNHLDEAQSKVEQLQIQLSRFKTELTDINIIVDMQVQVDGFLRFADYFFDGIFADWAVLDRIGKSQQQVRQTKSQIEQVLYKLDSLQQSIEEQQKQLKNQIAELVLKSEVKI